MHLHQANEATMPLWYSTKPVLKVANKTWTKQYLGIVLFLDVVRSHWVSSAHIESLASLLIDRFFPQNTFTSTSSLVCQVLVLVETLAEKRVWCRVWHSGPLFEAILPGDREHPWFCAAFSASVWYDGTKHQVSSKPWNNLLSQESLWSALPLEWHYRITSWFLKQNQINNSKSK